MTKQELSEAVAKKLGVLPQYDLWLVDDSARCFDLMCEYELALWSDTMSVSVPIFGIKNAIKSAYSDHNNDKKEATRWAIMNALLEMDI